MKLSELSNPRKLLMLVAGCTSDCDALTGCSSWVFNCAFDTPAARNAEKPRIRSDFIAIPLLDSCLMIKKNAMIVKPSGGRPRGHQRARSIELIGVVNPDNFNRVNGFDGTDPVLILPEYLEDIGQVVLSLRDVRLHEPEALEELLSLEHIDTGINFLQGEFLFRCVFVLHDPLDAPVLVADDPAVAHRVVKLRGENGGDSLRRPVITDEGPRRLLREERDIPREYEKISLE